MGFDRFGSVSFTTESKAAEFVTYLEQGRVMATRCQRCGAKHFPPKMDCPRCLSSDVEWFEITGTGRLVTYAVVGYGPTGFEGDTPYTLAIVDFGELRPFGRLSRDIDEGDIQVGMELRIAAVSLPDNRISYHFQLV